jgi:hypothetical protein
MAGGVPLSSPALRTFDTSDPNFGTEQGIVVGTRTAGKRAPAPARSTYHFCFAPLPLRPSGQAIEITPQAYRIPESPSESLALSC